jgi:hypothetical protein
MKSILFKFSFLMLLFATLFTVSCTKNTDAIDEAAADAYADEVVYRTQESGNLGRKGCFELVFPVKVAFPDSSVSSELNTYDEIKSAIREWKLANPSVKGRPALAFPYEVITEDGNMVTITSKEDEKALRESCRKNNTGHGGNGGPGGHGGHGPKLCFMIEFPFSVMLPDSTVITLNAPEDRKTLHEAIKAYREAHPGENFRPELVFPVTVIMEDKTVVTVNSKEELKALKDSCN